MHLSLYNTYMIHHEVMYHIVMGKRSAPNNRKTQMQYLKNSKVVWEKMKGKKYAGNADRLL